jgi:hypothetical protein
MEHIEESIESEWTDPANELPYETAEGGYQGEWCQSDDLFWTLGEEIGVDEFVADVIAAFGDRAWCRRDYFASSEDEALGFSWERFAEVVKYRSRYVFMLLPGDNEFAEHHEVEPARMLSKIGQLVVDAYLIAQIPAATVLYRARPHGRRQRFSTAADLGPPPASASRAGRMNPVGIPLFYGALDFETALAEVRDRATVTATVGRFTTTSAVDVVDLAHLPDVPSIFDAERRHLRPPLRFLHRFGDIVSEAVNRPPRSEQESVEYVPTQIVTDYFRNAFALEHDRPVSGLLYRSARNGAGTCCALFVDRDACADAGSGGPARLRGA